MKRVCAFLLALLLLCPLCAPAESVYWICPDCGQGGNDSNYCPNCGRPRPVPDTGGNLTPIPGETEWASVSILRIDGSSYVAGKNDEYQFAPWNAIDDDPETCWQFSMKKAKKNPPWLCMVAEGETVDGIWLRNGFQAADSKGKDQYPLYARPKDVRVWFVYTDENTEPVEMKFTLSDENSRDWDKLETGRHEDVDLVWFYVDTAYKGKSKPDNACLSEIMLVQRKEADGAAPLSGEEEAAVVTP